MSELYADLAPVYADFSVSPPGWADVYGEDQFGVFSEIRLNMVNFVFRWVPPGQFLMGSSNGENGRYINEGPRHVVRVSRGFWIGETPVTQNQWQEVMGVNPSRFKGGANPVEWVSWNDSLVFAGRLSSELSGLECGLPTEVQWEYACRAGTNTAFHNDDFFHSSGRNRRALDKVGTYRENSAGQTSPVRGKQPNLWGLYDMHGGVWEWCLDGLREYWKEVGADPLGAVTSGVDRAVRGGSWFDSDRDCRSARRHAFEVDERRITLGLRLVAGKGRVSEDSVSRQSLA